MSAPGVAFPGQVDQAGRIHTALDEHADHKLVRQLLERLGIDEPADVDVSTTRVAQPCTYVAGLVRAWRRWDRASVPVALGHSLGEITALAYSGAIDPVAGLDLVCELGELGHQQHQSRVAALVVLLGLDEPTVDWICRNAVADTGGSLETSGFNGPSQMVLSGDRKAAEQAAELATGCGGMAKVLPIHGAYHSSLMTEVLPRWRAAVGTVEFRDPVLPVISSVDARCRRTGDELADLLVRWLVLPVRWRQAVASARAEGAPQLWDAGPGRVLANIARRGSELEFLSG